MIMSELGPRAREILRSGRDLNRPTDADRERIYNALQERLGAALLLAEGGKALPSPRPRWPFVTGAVIGAGLLGGALFTMARQPAPPSAPRPLVAAASSAQLSPVPSALEPLVPDVPKPTASVAADRSAPSARSAEDRLAQEVALLARATSSLHAGQPADAMRVLDEYQRRFPKGLLTEERRAARAQALCSLGRESEAQAELARLAPESLAAARAKQVCDARSAVEK